MKEIKQFVAPYSFKEFYSNYPEGYSIYEAILEWINQVNFMVDVLNKAVVDYDALNQYIKESIRDKTTEELRLMLDSGELDTVIYTTLNKFNNIIRPENYTGSDKQKLVSAFDEAVLTRNPILIQGHYDLEELTIVLSKSQNPREPIFVFGGGSIHKSQAGFIFEGAIEAGGDYFFQNIRFVGNPLVDVSVFNCSDAKMIRVSTQQCHFEDFKNVYYANTYLQTIKSRDDTAIATKNAFIEANGLFNVIIDGLTMERSTGSLILHHGLPGEFNGVTNLVIKNSCLEDFKGAPVCQLYHTFNFVFDSNYLEANVGGHIVFNEMASCRGVSITNNVHLGLDSKPLIKWGRVITSCSSSNNNSTTNDIHDFTNSRVGSVLSFNDFKNYSQNAVIGDSRFLYNIKDLFQTKTNNTFINRLKNSSFQSNSNWDTFGGATLTINNISSFSGGSNAKVTGGPSYNCGIRQTVDGHTVGQQLLFVASVRSANNDSFTVGLVDKVSGSGCGFAIIETTKINEWETVAGIITVTANTATSFLHIYPKNADSSAYAVREFDDVALYNVTKNYNAIEAVNNIGYSVQRSGYGVNKLDPNGDGVADILYGTTAEKPSGLSINQYVFYYDTSLNQLQFWNGTSWKQVTFV